MEYVELYSDLTVYVSATELSDLIFKLSIKFPKEERYSLTDQIRRSSRSVGAQIAEAWGKRRYINHFISKLADAIGEVFETQHWVRTAVNCKYLDNALGSRLTQRYEEVNKMINSMINKADSFCVK